MPTYAEALFIRACVDVARPLREGRSVATATLGRYVEAFERARLVVYAYPDFYAISPRGLDLLATADAIDFDPATVLEIKQPRAECTQCELATRGETCKGSGLAPENPYAGYSAVIVCSPPRPDASSPAWVESVVAGGSASAVQDALLSELRAQLREGLTPLGRELR